mgnify:CR=1 FL=1
MTIDPKISMWLNIIAAVLSAVVGATAQLTTLFGQGKAQAIVSLCALVLTVIGAINGALHGLSGPQAGPIAKEG